MSKRQPKFPYRLGAWPREYHTEYPEDHPLHRVFSLADLREARVYRLSPTLWRFRTDDGALDIVTAYPERLAEPDFGAAHAAGPLRLPRRMTRAAMRNTAGARFL
jgi:hypothetical protein